MAKKISNLASPEKIQPDNVMYQFQDALLTTNVSWNIQFLMQEVQSHIKFNYLRPTVALSFSFALLLRLKSSISLCS